MATTEQYVHGYSGRENQRLNDQANCLVNLLHHDSIFKPGSSVLEAGCGVGAQTIHLTRLNPEVNFTCIDFSNESIKAAKQMIDANGIKNATFQQADIYNLDIKESFDYIFVCFVLEHLTDPVGALKSLKTILKPGGSIVVIEGDHGSAYFHPDSKYAQKAIQCLIDLQAQNGGNSLIGRELYPLLKEAGYNDINVSPRNVYIDSSRPEYVEGFTKSTFTAMIEGVEKQVIETKMISEEDWKRGIADLYRTAEDDGVFNYTFFKAVAKNV